MLKLIANHQMLYPDLICVFVDVERSFDPVWARLMGVDTDRLIVIVPDYAEQCVDMIEEFLYAKDVGLCAVDSLAALATSNEIESSAEKANVGGSSNPVGKLVRKTTTALGVAAKEGRMPTLIYVNQIRHKIGVMFGDPETTPGGNAPRFQISLWLRLYGKNKMDTKVSKVMPVLKEVSFILKKWKVPVLAKDGKFEMAMIPHNDLAIGQCDDWNSVSHHLKELGHVENHGGKKGWTVLTEHYDTIGAFRDRLFKDVKFGTEVRSALIARLLEDGNLLGDSPE